VPAPQEQITEQVHGAEEREPERRGEEHGREEQIGLEIVAGGGEGECAGEGGDVGAVRGGDGGDRGALGGAGDAGAGRGDRGGGGDFLLEAGAGADGEGGGRGAGGLPVFGRGFASLSAELLEGGSGDGRRVPAPARRGDLQSLVRGLLC